MKTSSKILNWYQIYYKSNFLDNLLKTQTHLFISNAGDGSEYLLEDILRKLMCESNDNFERICGTCPSCSYAFNEHPKLRIVDRNSELKTATITVEQIRDLSSFIELASTGKDDVKIIYIREADLLSNNAANALLKNLEEPPQNTYFILNCHDASKLLATIRSRATIHQLPQPSKSEALEYLNKGSHQDAAKYNDLADNKPFLAIDFAKESELISSIMSILMQGKEFNMINVDDSLLSMGSKFFIEIMQKWIFDLANYNEFQQVVYFGNLKNNIAKICLQLSHKETLNFYKKLNEYSRLSETTINKSIALDSLMIDYKRIFI